MRLTSLGRLLDLIWPARAGDDGRDAEMVQKPGDGDFGHRLADFLYDILSAALTLLFQPRRKCVDLSRQLERLRRRRHRRIVWLFQVVDEIVDPHGLPTLH